MFKKPKSPANYLKNSIALMLAGLFVVGCTSVPASSELISADPIISKTTKTQAALRALPPPNAKVTVAVYGFEDKTGQFRPTEAGQTLSRAVSQGGDEILIKALQDAGNRSWFTVIERSNLNNLLKERQIITEMRQRYLGETTVNSKALPPLLFAGVIFEGGIVGYDTNTITGGVAARYLGVGGQTDYRQNVVSVHLRAVSVKTGEVLASVTTEKTIASIGIAGNAFRFVSFDDLLEADAGITSNEPGLLALRQAVEKSVYALIMEGADIGLWQFNDAASGTALLNEYIGERDKAYQQIAATELSPALTPPSAQQPERPTGLATIFGGKRSAARKQNTAQPAATSPQQTVQRPIRRQNMAARQNVATQASTAKPQQKPAVATNQIDPSAQPQRQAAAANPQAKYGAIKVEHRPAPGATAQEAADAKARALALTEHLQAVAAKQNQTASATSADGAQ